MITSLGANPWRTPSFKMAPWRDTHNSAPTSKTVPKTCSSEEEATRAPLLLWSPGLGPSLPQRLPHNIHRGLVSRHNRALLHPGPFHRYNSKANRWRGVPHAPVGGGVTVKLHSLCINRLARRGGNPRLPTRSVRRATLVGYAVGILVGYATLCTVAVGILQRNRIHRRQCLLPSAHSCDTLLSVVLDFLRPPPGLYASRP